MDKKSQAHHPLIYTYLKKFQEDPRSRVFAPLAEAYRKAGMVKEAIDIAKEGLRFHPTFVGGRVALARALFDDQQYQAVIHELREVTQDVPDNLVAQRLVAESSLMLGHVAEALAAFKMLLYFSPEDQETARIVTELEAQAYEKGALVLRTDPKKAEFKESPAAAAIGEDPSRKRDAWIRRIELMQSLLQKVERYRVRNERRT